MTQCINSQNLFEQHIFKLLHLHGEAINTKQNILAEQLQTAIYFYEQVYSEQSLDSEIEKQTVNKNTSQFLNTEHCQFLQQQTRIHRPSQILKILQFLNEFTKNDSEQLTLPMRIVETVVRKHAVNMLGPGQQTVQTIMTTLKQKLKVFQKSYSNIIIDQNINQSISRVQHITNDIQFKPQELHKILKCTCDNYHQNPLHYLSVILPVIQQKIQQLNKVRTSPRLANTKQQQSFLIKSIVHDKEASDDEMDSIINFQLNLNIQKQKNTKSVILTEKHSSDTNTPFQYHSEISNQLINQDLNDAFDSVLTDMQNQNQQTLFEQQLLDYLNKFLITNEYFENNFNSFDILNKNTADKFIIFTNILERNVINLLQFEQILDKKCRQQYGQKFVSQQKSFKSSYVLLIKNSEILLQHSLHGVVTYIMANSLRQDNEHLLLNEFGLQYLSKEQFQKEIANEQFEKFNIKYIQQAKSFDLIQTLNAEQYTEIQKLILQDDINLDVLKMLEVKINCKQGILQLFYKLSKDIFTYFLVQKMNQSEDCIVSTISQVICKDLKQKLLFIQNDQRSLARLFLCKQFPSLRDEMNKDFPKLLRMINSNKLNANLIIDTLISKQLYISRIISEQYKCSTHYFKTDISEDLKKYLILIDNLKNEFSHVSLCYILVSILKMNQAEIMLQIGIIYYSFEEFLSIILDSPQKVVDIGFRIQKGFTYAEQTENYDLVIQQIRKYPLTSQVIKSKNIEVILKQFADYNQLQFSDLVLYLKSQVNLLILYIVNKIKKSDKEISDELTAIHEKIEFTNFMCSLDVDETYTKLTLTDIISQESSMKRFMEMMCQKFPQMYRFLTMNKINWKRIKKFAASKSQKLHMNCKVLMDIGTLNAAFILMYRIAQIQNYNTDEQFQWLMQSQEKQEDENNQTGSIVNIQENNNNNNNNILNPSYKQSYVDTFANEDLNVNVQSKLGREQNLLEVDQNLQDSDQSEQ